MPNERQEDRADWRPRDDDHFRALAEAVVASEEMDRRAARGPRPTRGPHVALKVLTAVLVPLALWTRFGSPPWLETPPAETSAEEDDGFLRMAMYLQAQRIEAHLAATGDLPATTRDAGDPVAGIDYTRFRDGRYRLAGRSEANDLVYDSSDPLVVLLVEPGGGPAAAASPGDRSPDAPSD